MRYGSVCSGIEAATAAWHPLGWTPVFFSEIDKSASHFLAHKYPDVPNYGDMTKFKDWPDAAIDVLVGGTPCQSFSVAGLRKGLADPRGNLMLTYLAIADRYRPQWLAWENVPGVLSSNGGRDFGAFLGGLGELGYGFAYRVLDAQYVRVESHPRAVPQRRRRVFVIGCLGDWSRAAAVLFERESLSGHPPPRREAGKSAPTIPSRRTGGGGIGTDFDCDGGLVTSTGEISHCLNGGGMGRIDYETETMIAHALRGEGRDASEDGTGRGTPIVPVAIPDVAMTLTSGGNGARGRMDPVNTDIIAVQGAATRENPESGPGGIGVRTDGAAYTLEARQEVQAIAFPERMSGTQVAATENLSPALGAPNPTAVMTLAIRGRGDSHQLEYRSDGTANAVLTPNGGRAGIGVGAVAFDTTQITSRANYSNPQPGDPCHPLAAGAHPPAIATQWAVRRLTPLECCRLQGFPDDYFSGLRLNKPFADGPLYKMLGNSMAVNVMSWIGQRIAAVNEIARKAS